MIVLLFGRKVIGEVLCLFVVLLNWKGYILVLEVFFEGRISQSLVFEFVFKFEFFEFQGDRFLLGYQVSIVMFRYYFN